MNQLTGLNVSQTNSVASMKRYRVQSELQPNSDAQPKSASDKSTRRRGVVLTQKGWQKLRQAGILYDDFGKRYTHEELSERSLLDARTVSRVLSCEVKVDKGTLKTFFQAFNLSLEAGDYNKFGNSSTTTDTSKSQELTSYEERESLSVNELMQLKQHILDDLNRLFNLLEKTSTGNDQFHNLKLTHQFLTQQN
jgi:hypothetical protein